MNSDTYSLENIDYHRNGISGEGFHVVTFTWVDDTRIPRKMVGVVFEAPGHVAVFDRNYLAQGTIDFGINSWRGDNFQYWLRLQVEAYTNKPPIPPVIPEGFKVIEATP